MYKQVYKYIQNKQKNRYYFTNELHKSIGKKPNAILNNQPHFIFSAENTPHPRKTDMDHESVLNLLKEKGYNADELFHVDEVQGIAGVEALQGDVQGFRDLVNDDGVACRHCRTKRGIGFGNNNGDLEDLCV